MDTMRFARPGQSLDRQDHYAKLTWTESDGLTHSFFFEDWAIAIRVDWYLNACDYEWGLA